MACLFFLSSVAGCLCVCVAVSRGVSFSVFLRLLCTQQPHRQAWLSRFAFSAFHQNIDRACPWLACLLAYYSATI